ncbi:hypothetical protein VSP9026_01143 [Vibrio spartinae]|uniref:Uncharacterized protein n=1 Tax=Vibrio spartinae TaxID=1918945 RepID=A0A1N6M221_9VIBR|nr:hypothetical protein VSP9026_01143 [Vibrio spartinae]
MVIKHSNPEAVSNERPKSIPYLGPFLSDIFPDINLDNRVDNDSVITAKPMKIAESSNDSFIKRGSMASDIPKETIEKNIKEDTFIAFK